jgi:hypothetical protein
MFIIIILFFIFFIYFIIIIEKIITYNNKNFRENFIQLIIEKNNNSLKNNNIFLLGDSILNNKKYVGINESIYDGLVKRINKNNIFIYAEDGAYINDVFYQIDKIPYSFSLENKNNIFILSIGGNDLLGGSDIDTTFLSYKKLIETIKVKFPNNRLILFDIYEPYNIEKITFLYTSISKLKENIKLWNNKLYKFCNENNIEIIKISNYINEEKDFTNIIEPSKYGSIKIVDNILQHIT